MSPVQEHVSLRDITWFKTGGVGDYYVVCHTLSELIQAVKEAYFLHVPYLIMGQSSNMLMSDSGFPGIVIHNQTQGMMFLHDRTQIMVESGTPLNQLVTRTISNGYSGLEFLAGIPGTMGGAVYNNVRAFGYELSNYVKSATLLFPSERITNESIKRVDNSWFKFGYATSKLKRKAEGVASPMPVILSVTLQLSKMNPNTCFGRANEYWRLRHHDDPSTSALMAFDSVRYDNAQLSWDKAVNQKPMEQKHYFLTQTDLRQWTKGEIYLFRDNPNFIINNGLGTSREARALVTTVQEAISSEDSRLAVLIEYVGMWD